MRKYGLIGFPLSHSFSEKFFSEKFQSEGILNTSYQLFPIQEIGDLKELLLNEATSLKGLNVTIPYKVSVLSFLHQISDEARAIGAVNCIKITPKQELEGYNTDVYGFLESLKPLLQPQHQKALVFGNGGATKAVIYALQKLNIKFKIVSRIASDTTITYDLLNKDYLQSHTLLINTTPLGMLPNVLDAPKIPYEWVTAQHLAFDLIYNPEETIFLKKCAAQGAQIKNGLEMLHLQALKAWEIWNQ